MFFLHKNKKTIYLQQYNLDTHFIWCYVLGKQ